MRGVYMDHASTVTDLTRIEALRLVLPPDGVVAGLTAAWLHGAWQPRPGAPLPLEVSTPKPRARPRTSLTGSHRQEWWDGDIVELQGLRVVSRMRTAFDLMRRASLVEAVAIVDSFGYQELVEPLEFAIYVDGHRRWPGVDHCRQAITLSSPLARSAGESRLRMIAVLGGLPEPLVNPPYYRDGELIGYPDLLLMGPHERCAGVEYDGEYHGGPSQHSADLRRENRFVVLGTLPLLRYDRHSVARHSERLRVLHEMSCAIGVPSLGQLPPSLFAHPRRDLRW